VVVAQPPLLLLLLLLRHFRLRSACANHTASPAVLAIFETANLIEIQANYCL
jgi:hypothetical protein